MGDAGKATVALPSGQRVPARVWARDARGDLAVLTSRATTCPSPRRPTSCRKSGSRDRHGEPARFENRVTAGSCPAFTPGPVTPEIAQQLDLPAAAGAVVMDLQEGGPADDAGVRPGDIVVAAGGEPVEQVEDLSAVLRRHEPGDRVELEVLRDGERRTLAITLEDRP